MFVLRALALGPEKADPVKPRLLVGCALRWVIFQFDHTYTVPSDQRC